MKKYETLGQEAVEFVILSTLIAIALLVTIFSFKDKLVEFFNNSPAKQNVSSSESNILSPSSELRYKPNTDSSIKSVNVAGYNVITNADGSITFNVNNQKINISAEAVSLQSSVIQTSGSSGIETLVKEVAYMVNKYASEYPGEPVPLNISYGITNKYCTDDRVTTYKGTAEANITQIMVGNNFVMIQKDQSCSSIPGGCVLGTDNIYRMEGTLSGNDTFKNVSCTSYNGETFTGTYNGSVNDNNIFSGKLSVSYQGIPHNYDLKLDFSNPDNSFVLK